VSQWAQNLRPAQVREIKAIMRAHSGRQGRDGFRIYMVGSIGSPRYVELRLYGIDGRLLRTWPIA
jgi:hypothetical protein